MIDLPAQLDAVAAAVPYRVVGHVESLSGGTIQAVGLPLPVGALCRIDSLGGRSTEAEVIGFQEQRTLLMPLGAAHGIARGDTVENLAVCSRLWCSEQLLGRVLDGRGRPIDGRPLVRTGCPQPLHARGAAPLQRQPIDRPLATGIAAIDALHTCGQGQRLGIFSGPGVGKSVLLASIARHTSADVCVVAMVGERAREVHEFIDGALGAAGLARSVVIVSTSDDPPLLRVRAAQVACAVAEYFRDRQRHVLLLVDSLTRLCHAQRQIGLAAHEPPATRGYPPSVFALLPQLLERAGRSGGGSITGFYTVLVEGDDFNEPIADAVKSTTDGHLWLSRALANRGHWPAIDVLQSISRVRDQVLDAQHLAAARRVLALLAAYQEIEDLVSIGAYVAGLNRQHDLAVTARQRILDFLKQDTSSGYTLQQTRQRLLDLCHWIDQHEQTLARPLSPAGGK